VLSLELGFLLPTRRDRRSVDQRKRKRVSLLGWETERREEGDGEKSGIGVLTPTVKQMRPFATLVLTVFEVFDPLQKFQERQCQRTR